MMTTVLGVSAQTASPIPNDFQRTREPLSNCSRRKLSGRKNVETLPRGESASNALSGTEEHQ